MKIVELITKEKQQLQILIALSLVVLTLTGIVDFYHPQLYPRFFGTVNPLLAVLGISFLGIILLSILIVQGWFVVYKKEGLKKRFFLAGCAALFVAITIMLDLKIVFPADMNVLFPASIFFYPAIAFVVEILFHLIPLTIILFLLTTIFKLQNQPAIWLSIFLVALPEPIYQAAQMHAPLWAVIFVVVHLFGFNLFQLVIFKRYDFLAMYTSRLAYYLIWHIIWGQVRLHFLF